MNKSELIEVIADKANIKSQKSKNLVDIFFDSIIKALSETGRVEIRGFGAFTVRKYKAYEGRNPKTGERVRVDEKRAPFWKSGQDLRKRVDRENA